MKRYNNYKSYKYKKNKISAPTWHEEFELPDGFYIRYSRLFWIYIKKHGEKTVHPSISIQYVYIYIYIYINKIENRITFKIKTGYYLEALNSWNNKITW